MLKSLTTLILLVNGAVIAQPTATSLPSDIVGALVFYHPGVNGAKINGSFFAAMPFPGANPGTFIYNAVDIVSQGHGRFITVPQTGFAQHILWIGNNIDLFGLLTGGISLVPVQSTSTNISSAFAGGGGINIRIGSAGLFIPIVLKVENSNKSNSLIVGIGIEWGHYSTSSLTRTKKSKTP